MSIVKVQGNASGTGTFTIAAPATNTDRTLTLPDSTGSLLTSDTLGSFGFRNRIINGDMRIDQRNAGASVSAANNNFSVDRFLLRVSQTSKYTAQQNAGSVTPPVGFSNYLGATSSSAWSLGSGDYAALEHRVEGFNVSDFAWGTANAAPITLSFRVYSSLTGTFGGCITNGGFDRSYPFSYSVAAANTWTTVSVTIPGDTTGTWPTGNSTGLRVWFSLGVGSTFQGTVNTWAGAGYIAPASTVSVVSTNGATFYITGVQLEAGTVATPFERLDYGRQLIQCQRYFQMHVSQSGQSVGNFAAYSTTYGNTVIDLKVSMRTAPTIYQVSGTNYFAANSGGSGRNFDSFTLQQASENSVGLYNTGGTIAGAAGDAGWFASGNVSARIGFQAEL